MNNFNERQDQLYDDLRRAYIDNDLETGVILGNRWSALAFAWYCVDSGTDVEFTIDDVGLDALYTRLVAGEFGEVKMSRVKPNVRVWHVVNGVGHMFQWADAKLYFELNKWEF